MPRSRFPQVLRQLRMELGLVQDDVARIAGVSQRGIPSNWESGKRTPDIDTQLVLADFFGCSLDYLHGREGAPRDSPAVASAKTALRKHLARIPIPADATPGDTMVLVHEVLQRLAPSAFPRERVAAHLLLSPAALDELVARRVDPQPAVLMRLASLTGIPEQWFWTPTVKLLDETPHDGKGEPAGATEAAARDPDQELLTDRA